MLLTLLTLASFTSNIKGNCNFLTHWFSRTSRQPMLLSWVWAVCWKAYKTQSNMGATIISRWLYTGNWHHQPWRCDMVLSGILWMPENQAHWPTVDTWSWHQLKPADTSWHQLTLNQVPLSFEYLTLRSAQWIFSSFIYFYLWIWAQWIPYLTSATCNYSCKSTSSHPASKERL